MSDVHTAVLVVEDEMLVRMDIVDELISAGFEVLEAGDADEAIAVLNDVDLAQWKRIKIKAGMETATMTRSHDMPILRSFLRRVRSPCQS